MHLNISSIEYHLHKLSDLINQSKIKFSVTGITNIKV